MFLDIRNNDKKIIMVLPCYHVFIASSELDEPISDGCSTGDFPHFDTAYHIAEGFIPLTDSMPDFDVRYQHLIAGDSTVANDGKSAVREWLIIDADISNVKKSRISEVSTLRKSDEKTAIYYTVGDVNYLMHADDKTFNNLTGFLKRLVLNGSKTQNFWYFDDDQALSVNVTQATAMLNLIADHQQSLRDNAAAHIAAINALTTALDVLNYDITTGW